MADINDIIEQNLGLVYQQLRRFKLSDNQDAESLAYEALYNAVKTYDANTGNKLSTYAVCVISNALQGYLRTANKKRQILPLSYNVLVEGNDGETAEMLEFICGPNTTEDAVFLGELHERLHQALHAVYDDLYVEKHRHIFELWYCSGFMRKQTDIARELGVSAPYVSHVLSVVKNKLRQQLEDYV